MDSSSKQPDGYCSVNKYLTLFSTKWTAHIVWLLSTQNEVRFGQIQKQLVFASSKVLAERLKLLVRENFVWRRQEDSVPPNVYYGLTSKGEELAAIVKTIIRKSDDWDKE
ncbi:hypothetical protein TUMSATVNIG1_47460 [Vibrio nigripulchritudo]|uniref:winged helix-turn-helix transcriptional regulator n=1 Tax=Vibrio nigripulchritudo TaxID=28173 RepID=UPI00190C0A43|nr:helix-turn-helix domain-containing protein [Vibrio nigripulchritudo]BCL72775.1 hypothetical protein VNTUMSATTG_47120 [Vibrio nigripulchritudo]BDU34137.1 hypothetical protein TUMSATVNIG1_47460 [Vibrio nigripulchritudo]